MTANQRGAALCVVACVLGYGGKAAWVSSQQAGPGASVAAEPVAAAPTRTNSSPTSTQVVEACDAPDVLAMRERVAHADEDCALRLRIAGGVDPVAWPEPGPGIVTAEMLEPLLEEALAECPQFSEAVLQTDCGEFPCMVFLKGVGDLTKCGTLGALPNVRMVEQFVGIGPHRFHAWAFQPDAESMPPELADDVAKRQSIRMTEVVEMNVPPEVLR